MLRSQYALLAEFAREGTSGKFDILGVFDRVFAKRIPAVHPRMVLVFLLVAESEDDLGKKKRVRLRLTAPSGQVLLEQTGSMDVKPAGGTSLAGNRLIFEIANLALPGMGKYRFQLDVDGVTVAEVPFSVAPAPAKPVAE
jgi:hypothetical protein